MNPRYPRIALWARHRCEYWHAPEAVFNFPFALERIVPVAREGRDMEVNLALACRSCNLCKAAHRDGIDPEDQAAVRLFHPREDHWEEHFRAESGSARIEGLTAVGRATVARLEMNSEAQREAQRQWMRLGLFPSPPTRKQARILRGHFRNGTAATVR